MSRNLPKVWKAIGFLKAENQQNKEAISKPKNDYFDTSTNDLNGECYNSWMVSCHLFFIYTYLKKYFPFEFKILHSVPLKSLNIESVGHSSCSVSFPNIRHALIDIKF